jgi:hypothetical protein
LWKYIHLPNESLKVSRIRVILNDSFLETSIACLCSEKHLVNLSQVISVYTRYIALERGGFKEMLVKDYNIINSLIETYETEVPTESR